MPKAIIQQKNSSYEVWPFLDKHTEIDWSTFMDLHLPISAWGVILMDYSAAIQELFSFLGIGTKQFLPHLAILRMPSPPNKKPRFTISQKKIVGSQILHILRPPDNLVFSLQAVQSLDNQLNFPRAQFRNLAQNLFFSDSGDLLCPELASWHLRANGQVELTPVHPNFCLSQINEPTHPCFLKIE